MRRIRISNILFAVRKRIILIVILSVIGLAVGVLLGTAPYLRGEVRKQYLITTSIAVNPQNANDTFISDMQNPGFADIYLAEDVVIYVIRSDRTLNTAAEKLNLTGVTAKDIHSNLKASSTIPSGSWNYSLSKKPYCSDATGLL